MHPPMPLSRRQHQHGQVVFQSPAGKGQHLFENPIREALHGHLRIADESLQPLVPEELAVATGLDHPVGVEDQPVVDAQVGS